MHRAHFLLREAMLAAGSAASLAALLIWLGPPGNDLAAHVYQRTVFLHNGFQLWNNFWYGGRYSFVTYSVLYYPLAAVFGIRALAIISIGIAALAFAIVVCRQFGPLARWSSRTFAVVWSLLVISAAFPFALGFALGLLALVALQAGRRWLFGILAVLTVAASPLAFLLLAIFLAGIGLGMLERGRRLIAPAAIVLFVAACQFLLMRAFADGGRYPFSEFELMCILTFCVLGALLTWRVEYRARAPLVLRRLRRRQSRHLRVHDSARREHRARPTRRCRSRSSCSRSGAGAHSRSRRSCSCSPRCGTSARTPGRCHGAHASTKRRARSTGRPRRSTCTRT